VCEEDLIGLAAERKGHRQKNCNTHSNSYYSRNLKTPVGGNQRGCMLNRSKRKKKSP
jgi:hypothetical protein